MDRSLSGLKWVLLASLLFNAAFLGFAVAQAMGRGFGPRPPMLPQIARPNNLEVPEKTRAVLNEAFQGDRPEMEKALRDLQGARRKTVGILGADPLDQKELDTAMEQMRTKTLVAQEIYQRIISNAATKLDAEERVTLARILDVGAGRFQPGGPFGPRPGQAPNGGPPRP